MKRQALTTMQQWEKHHTENQNPEFQTHFLTRSFNLAMSLTCKTSTEKDLYESLTKQSKCMTMTREPQSALKQKQSSIPHCPRDSGQTAPSHSRQQKCRTLTPAALTTGLGHPATLSRPAGVLSVFIRLFQLCQQARWEQLDAITLQLPISGSPA